MYIVKYDGKEIGRVVSNQSLVDQEVIKLAGVDLNGKDPYGESWAWELFEIEAVETATNTKGRSLEIYAAAVEMVKLVDVNEAVQIRPLAHKLAKQIGCDYSTAKRHIANAVRCKRGELVELHQGWGGPREGSGYPKGEPRKTSNKTTGKDAN